MRAGLGVDAFVGQPQPFYGPSADKVLLDDGRRVLGLHMAVPDSFGINHDRRSVFTLVKTARFIDAYLVPKAGRLGKLLQLCVQFTLAVSRAGWSRSALGAGIVADKDMVLKWGQSKLLLHSAYRAYPAQRFHICAHPARPHLRE